MSLIIAVHVGEGIVLASDSRTTYTRTDQREGVIIKSVGIHTTETTYKTFACPNGSGISTCGEASLNGMPITGMIQSFIREKINEETMVSEIPQLLIDYFKKGELTPKTRFIVAGYQKIGEEFKQMVYSVILDTCEIIHQNPEGRQGAVWDGESITLTKLIAQVALVGENNQVTPLPHYEILWGHFTMQDAIDFAKYAIETTINTMRFQNVVETVGKPIDILVIQPEKTYWINKKELHFDS